MSTSLLPMNLGEILDRSFHIYRSRFRLFLAIGALPVLATLAVLAMGLILKALLDQTTLDHSIKLGIEHLASRVSVELWLSFFGFAAWPRFIHTAAQNLFGQQQEFRAIVAHCASRWRTWIVIPILLWSTWNGIPAILYGIPLLERARLNAMLSLGRGLSTILDWPRDLFLLWAGWLLALAVSTTLWFCVPVWVLESLNLRSVLRRGRALVRRARFRVMLAWFLLTALGLILTGSISFLLVLLLRSFPWFHRPDLSFAIFRATLMIPQFVVSILVAPLFPIALTLFYYDQRIRQEGFDIEWMMTAAGMNAPVSVEPVPVAAAESGEPSA